MTRVHKFVDRHRSEYRYLNDNIVAWTTKISRLVFAVMTVIVIMEVDGIDRIRENSTKKSFLIPFIILSSLD